MSNKTNVSLKDFRLFNPIDSAKLGYFVSVAEHVINLVIIENRNDNHNTPNKFSARNDIISFINTYGYGIRQVGQRQMFIRPCGCNPYGMLVWYVYSYYTCVGVITIDIRYSNRIDFYTTKDKISPTTSKQKTMLANHWNMRRIYCDNNKENRADKIYFLKLIKEAK